MVADKIVNKHILRSWIEVDFDRLESNVRSIKNSLPKGVKYVAVVKADAYGHCMPQALVRFLRGGADLFAVANLYEASRVREVVSDRQVLVLSPILKEERPLVFDYGATPAVSSYAEAQAFDELAAKRGKILGAHIKLDTGMGRAGVWHEKADEVFPKILSLPHLKINGIFSHLSSADTDRDYTFGQVEIFRKVVCKYGTPDMLLHIHNSAGLSYIPIEPPLNAVRMGLVQYGINPFDDGGGFESLGLRSVLAFKARILAVGERGGKKIASVCAATPTASRRLQFRRPRARGRQTLQDFGLRWSRRNVHRRKRRRRACRRRSFVYRRAERRGNFPRRLQPLDEPHSVGNHGRHSAQG